MTPENRHSYTADLMARAAESLETAQETLAIRRPKVAVSQACYAMFYAASALLIHRRRHGGVKAAFVQYFCKRGDIEPRFGTVLDKAFDMRLACDYKARYKQAPQRG